MEKQDLVAHIATQLVVAQISAGAKHPSPGLITEATATAQALVDELEDHFRARELLAKQALIDAEHAQAKKDAAAKAALDAKVAAEEAAKKPPAVPPVAP